MNPEDIRILVVDDDPDVLCATVHILTEAKFQVVTGTSATEAIELARRHHPALLLQDVELPDGNGRDVARQLKADPTLADLFVILVSGTRITVEDQVKGLDEGLADGYITRPFSKVEFLARINAFLRIRATQEALRESLRERQKVEMALQKSEESLSITLNSIGDGMIATDVDGRITRMNPAAERLTGWSQEAAAGCPIAEVFRIINAQTREPVPDPVQKVLDQGKIVGLANHTALLARDGHEYQIADSAAPIRNRAGQIVGVVLVFSDVSEQYRMREAIQQRLVALTQPLDNTEGLQFSDLFDIEDIQRLQDQFSNATGVASIITAPDGTPITQASNFTRLCLEVVRGTEKGRCNCLKSDAVLGRHSPSGPMVQKCLSCGLWDAGASITVGGKHVANWLIGQVRNEAQNEEQMLRYADEIGADRETFRRALAEVPFMSRKHFEQTAQMLFTLARELSSRAYQNIQQARFINERKQAEEALQETRSTLQAAMDNSQAGIAIADAPDGRLRYVNKAGLLIRGKSEAESVAGIDINQYVSNWQLMDLDGTPLERDEVPLARAVLYGETCSRDFIIRRPDNEDRIVWANAAPILDSNGKVKAGIVVFQDITERKQLEETLLRTQRMESLGTLASGVAHDLNNILTPIILATEMLYDVDEPDSRKSLLKSIEQSAKRGANVVNQVLVFARGAKGERSNLELKHIVQDMEKMMRETFPRNITISSSIPSGLWPVNGDPTQLQQVLLNLCINARDAMPGGGTLSISVENAVIDEAFATRVPFARAGNYVMLSFADTGIGIPHEFIGKVFEPFFTTKELGKGTGLGLSTVIGIVRSHSGFVTVESEEGRGSTFKVFLPIEKGGPAEQTPLEKTTSLRGREETILVVDDEVFITETTAMVLENCGFKVLAATSGTEALALYREHSTEIDLVLTDVMMPGMDGVELSHALREINPEVKIIASTGQVTDIRQSGLRALGVNVILRKPYNAKTLLATMHDVIHEER